MCVSVTVTPVVQLRHKPAIPMNNDDFSLFCDVEGPYDSIKWIRNSRPLVFNDTMTPVNTTELKFRPLTIANDGIYQCEVANILKRHMSEPYELLASCESFKDFLPLVLYLLTVLIRKG